MRLLLAYKEKFQEKADPIFCKRRVRLHGFKLSNF